jgi:hypothetical protein
MGRVEKFEVDSSHFKGIRILYDYLSEGVEYAKNNNIHDICIWEGTDGNEPRRKVNFDFLTEMESIKTFHCLMTLSKKSNIDGLYSLKKLKNFRWSVNNDFEIDFAKLHTIKTLNIKYSDSFYNWDKLTQLSELYLNSVKTNDLSFLSGLQNLKILRIIGGNFTSLKGLEGCKNLTNLRLVRCPKLKEIDSVIKLKKLDSLVTETCKNLSINEADFSIRNIGIF